jgi:hypothetical protein
MKRHLKNNQNKTMKNTKNNLMKGFANLIVMIIVAVLVIGGGAYLVLKQSPTQKVTQVESAVNDISVSVPSLDFSSSPVPDLNVSALNVGAPQISTGNIFSAPSVNTNFSYNANVDIAMPTVSASDLNFTMPSIPTNISTGNQPIIPNGGAPTSVPPSGATQPTGGGQPSVDCSQFASVPSCSYIGDPNGNAACKQCFPNK